MSLHHAFRAHRRPLNMTEQTEWTDAELRRLLDEGLRHLNRLQSGSATERDAADFLAWRTRSRAHEEAFRSAVRLQRLVRSIDADERTPGRSVTDAVESGDVVPITLAAERRVSRRLFLGGSLAASMAGGLFAAGRYFDLVPALAELRADYRTGPGERQMVQLAGGASVDLNTRTSIRLRQGARQPTVELIGGEVIMDGAGQGAALVAGDGISHVRAGRLAARRLADQVCITCLDGEVVVAWQAQRRRLRPLDEVRYTDAALEERRAGGDLQMLTAWQSGTLIFRDMPMRQVVEEINRYRTGKVYLASETLAERSLTGTYYIDRLNDFFQQAELGLGVTVTRLPGNIVVLS